MQKSISIEHHFTQKEVEIILRSHLHSKLEKEDIDFKDARYVQDDFTHNSDHSIDCVVIIDDCKFRKPK